MTPKFFDVHTHTQDKQYDLDRDVVIRRALNDGVGMVQVGTDFSMSKKAVELAEKYENVYATVGLHPTDNKKEEFNFDAYKKISLASKKVVAIGECGLDYFRGADENEKERQKKVFLKQIELAGEIKKPLIIHCREAFTDLLDILKTNDYGLRTPAGVVHFFSGSVEDAKKFLDLGFYFSFGGVVTFARDYDEQIKFIPLDRILVETDAPYVAPVPYRGKRNEPSYIIEVVKKIAEIKGATLEEIAQISTNNARLLFGT